MRPESQSTPFEATMSEKDLRAMDVKKFWVGFQKFRYSESKLESTTRRLVLDSCNGYYSGQVETPIEAIMLFLYGANLSKNEHPFLTKEIKIPRIEIKRGYVTNFGSRYSSDPGTMEVSDVWFKIGIDYIVSTHWGSSFQVDPWIKEHTQSVSRNLPDWAIVDTVIAGAEEFAHISFYKLKNRDRFRKAVETKSGTSKSEVVYHAGDIERRGLIWQKEVLNKHFPHWTQPTRELIEKVSKLRITERTNRNKKFWQKLHF